jgi:hypothetical protein
MRGTSRRSKEDAESTFNGDPEWHECDNITIAKECVWMRLLLPSVLVLIVACGGGGLSGVYSDEAGMFTYTFDGPTKVTMGVKFMGSEQQRETTYEYVDHKLKIVDPMSGSKQVAEVDADGCFDLGMMIGKICPKGRETKTARKDEAPTVSEPKGMYAENGRDVLNFKGGGVAEQLRNGHPIETFNYEFVGGKLIVWDSERHVAKHEVAIDSKGCLNVTAGDGVPHVLCPKGSWG